MKKIICFFISLFIIILPSLSFADPYYYGGYSDYYNDYSSYHRKSYPHRKKKSHKITNEVANTNTTTNANMASATTPALGPGINWYDNVFFNDPSFSYQFIKTLGFTYSEGADLGESITTAKAIKPGDINSWYQEWLTTANRIYNYANDMQKQGENISAKEAYLRASNYYRTASFYMVAAQDRETAKNISSFSKKSFLNAIAYMPAIQPVKIPYENTALPGYFIRSQENNAPLLIVHGGYDGTAEELYFQVGRAAHQRGFNVLIFEGPGQGEVLRQQGIPFRHDWEHVVTPVIDYAMALPNIDKNKIALMGISMGGYLAARAAAFDNRIKACVVNGGIYDMSESVTQFFPEKILTLLKEAPEKFNDIIYNQMQNSISVKWFFNNAMWAFQANSPAQVMSILKQYSLKDVVDKIKCPMLVIDSESDMFFKNQPKKLYDLLTSPKQYLLFTRQQGADAHCQMGEIAISNEEVFSWLKNIL